MKKKASDCKFGTMLDEMLKDKFICGLSRGPILDKLCEEDHTTPLQNILEMAIKREAAFSTMTAACGEMDYINVKRKQCQQPRPGISSGHEYRKQELKGTDLQTHPSHVMGEMNRCRSCGEGNHNFSSCKFKKYRCRNCQQIGHLAKACKILGNHSVDISEKSEPCLNFVHMNYCENSKVIRPLTVSVVINNKPLCMELDSGAGISVIPKSVYDERFSMCRLKETDIRLRMYDNHIVVPAGEINVQICYNGIRKLCRLIVVEGGTRSLFGRDLMDAFEIFKAKMDEELDRLEKEGVPLVTNSELGTPLVPVMRPDGRLRLCVDYKVTVNKYLDDIKHPLPRIEELFAALQGGEYFTKLDFYQAYNQLESTDETKKLLAWSTHRGIFVPNRLPFGTKPACALFQKSVEKVLQGLTGVINFLDDIVVTGKSREEPFNNLNIREIKYLGHVIDKEGLHKDPDKVRAMVEVPRQRNVPEVKAFIGMVNYYAKFKPRLATVLNPLHGLLKANTPFRWTIDCERSFQQVKAIITSDQSLAHYDPSVDIKLVCDASNVGLGAVLFHVYPDKSEKPICFASRTLNPTERRYSVIHREALAIYWGVNKFYQYLMGREFILCSDHKPLSALFGEKKAYPKWLQEGYKDGHCSLVGLTIPSSISKGIWIRQLMGKVFLIMIDAFSKWPEVFEMTETDSQSMIEKLRLFAPYHPSTNGAAENCVQTFKEALHRLLGDVRQAGLSMCSLVSKYLFSYRTTPHCATNETPAKLMFGREPKTRLSFLSASFVAKNNRKQIDYHHGQSNINFNVGEVVYVKDYRVSK
ncbi:uncharacterized protein LOC124172976 [Ischnura elegans]|uniref:uncharacterized protein LOC124172976 n=1 Tax=Ischnura elegans TaxID=197161 RepID=UPI001ED87425|nr:uncharacterized protein LOC124172976 [Ischnura elegans]